MTAWIRSKPVELGDPLRIKELNEMCLGWEGSGLQFRIGTQNSLDEAITWGSYTNASVGFQIEELDIAGRYISLELYSTGTGDSWEVSAIDVNGRIAGTR